MRSVGGLEGGDAELGHKGKHGILHNTASRSILWCRALQRAGFVSTEEVGKALIAFIDYFSRLLAKSFRWTYKGRLSQCDRPLLS